MVTENVVNGGSENWLAEFVIAFSINLNCLYKAFYQETVNTIDIIALFVIVCDGNSVPYSKKHKNTSYPTATKTNTINICLHEISADMLCILVLCKQNE